MKVEKIDHIHARVKDLDGAIRLFNELLGVEFGPVWELSDSYGVRDAVNPLGLDLVEVTDPNGRAQKEIGHLQREGINAISLKVPDIKEAIAELESRGIKMVGPLFEQKTGKGWVRQAWFDPTKTFGVQIELCEFPGESAFVHASSGQSPE